MPLGVEKRYRLIVGRASNLDGQGQGLSGFGYWLLIGRAGSRDGMGAERRRVDGLFLVEETQVSASKYFAIDSPRRGGAQMAKTGNDSKKASRAPPKHSALQPGWSWRRVSGQKRYFSRGLGDFHLTCIAHCGPPLAVSCTLKRYPFLMDKGSFRQSCAPAEARSVIASSACLGLSWSRLTVASRSQSLRHITRRSI